MRVLYLSLLLSLCTAAAGAQNMDNDRIAALLEREVQELEGDPGFWQFVYGERALMLITDPDANRMRIFTPVLEDKYLDEEQLRRMLEANFHSALDAKYALYGGYVISVFTHPLRELSESQLLDALRQVVNLADNFGSTYSSTGLIFAPEAPEETPKINQSPSGGKKN